MTQYRIDRIDVHITEFVWCARLTKLQNIER